MLNGNINSVGKIADTSGEKINFDNGILVIDESNNRVGIGTASPSRRLEINQAGAIVSTKITGNNAGGHLIDIDHANSGVNSYNGFRFLDEGDNSRGLSLTHIGASSGRGKFQIGTSDSGTGAILSIDGDNARVGIGTLSPGAKLHLEQGNLRINSATDGFQVVEFAETGTVKSKLGYNFNNDSFTIRTTDTSGNLDTRVSIFSNTDNSLLQIVNDGQSILSLNNTASNGDQFRIISKVNGSTAGLLFRDESNTTDIMTLTQDGNVGIATSTPASKLEVEGVISSSGANLTMKDNSGNNITSASQSEGKITVTHNYHQVTHNAGDDTNDVRLHTIDGGVDGAILVLKQQSNTKDIKIMDGTGNLRLAGSGGHFQMDTGNDTITFVYSGSLWFEISRSDNA